MPFADYWFAPSAPLRQWSQILMAYCQLISLQITCFLFLRAWRGVHTMPVWSSAFQSYYMTSDL
jgi:hypothetical protein